MTEASVRSDDGPGLFLRVSGFLVCFLSIFGLFFFDKGWIASALAKRESMTAVDGVVSVASQLVTDGVGVCPSLFLEADCDAVGPSIKLRPHGVSDKLTML